MEKKCRLNITLATGAVGWNTLVNNQLLIELANNPKVKVTGLVPSSTQEQKEQAKKLNVELVDGKELDGFSPKERLSFPPDYLEIDVLIMHSYGLHEGKHAQVIGSIKKCKWFHIVHTISEELAKYMDKKYHQESEHQLQLKLSQKADCVIAIGPKVADHFRSELCHCGKSNDVVNLTPGIMKELVDVRASQQRGEIFRILISATWFAKYYKVKGLDIAAKAMTFLKEVSCHLIYIVNPDEDTEDLINQLLQEGIELDQFTVRPFQSSNLENWKRQLCQVNLIIMPARTEGFGTTNLRAISADLPVLVSQNCGFGMALKKLPSGGKHVIRSNKPEVWAERIKEVLENSPEDLMSEAKKLRKEYEEEYNWEKQCDDLVDRMLTMFPSKQEDFKRCVEHSEESDQARGGDPEVQQYETELMVYEERMPENGNLRSPEETVDALQSSAQELSLVTREFESNSMNYKEKIEIFQDRTQEVDHAAAKEVKKKGSGFDQADGAAATLDGVNDSESNRDQTGQPVKAQDIPYSILSKICLKLNAKDDLSFRDFRLLGEKMGFDKDLTKVLEQKRNPTYELFQLWHPNPKSTVENLLMILKDDEMGRWDVATVLEDWLEEKGIKN